MTFVGHVVLSHTFPQLSPICGRGDPNDPTTGCLGVFAHCQSHCGAPSTSYRRHTTLFIIVQSRLESTPFILGFSILPKYSPLTRCIFSVQITIFISGVLSRILHFPYICGVVSSREETWESAKVCVEFIFSMHGRWNL